MTPVAPMADLADGTTINTDTGAIVSNGNAVVLPSFTVVQQGTNVQIRVFITRQLILRNTTVNGTRALAFVSDDSIRVNGELKASPGASDPTRCTTAGGGTSGGRDGIGSGGGGGGYATAGGAGGGAFGSVGAGGGAIVTELEPLAGGCSGGSVPPKIGGGPGGSAIQLVSRTSITVAVVGTSLGRINVGGFGGGTNDDTEAEKIGGGGGGSGGSVLLEAPVVILAGTGAIIAANGGGGGDGCGELGASGTSSRIRAPGGRGCNASFTAGGSGAADGSSGTAAPASSGTSFGASGGGGGGMGYVVVRNATGQFVPQDGAALSAALKQLILRKRPRS